MIAIWTKDEQLKCFQPWQLGEYEASLWENGPIDAEDIPLGWHEKVCILAYNMPW